MSGRSDSESEDVCVSSEENGALSGKQQVRRAAVPRVPLGLDADERRSVDVSQADPSLDTGYSCSARARTARARTIDVRKPMR